MTRIRFEDLPSTNTPINAENLNKLNNVIVSSKEPTTGEEVWIDNVNKKIHTKTDNGYEEFYNEEEQLLKSNIIIENITLPEITITSGTRTNTYKSVAKDGYTPLGIVGIDGTNDYVSMGKFLINPSNETAFVTVVNSNVNSQTTKITLTILYIKK